ncbi:axin interactor, dorsalization-associated protein-like [Pomacea canaliculata]|uniref:axin interactor, dorsalization-associated protein-like n=1 Tax=Pomacea canaliculata TaxID=400727 RepID=UPI000D73D529|nr:axin interactor, dorsalization-associated protein-like [Pomacea canaliculata]XP_025106113.1 axin interactor, dorsalization-associated protein-like [Pomacea canaliculata]XP_025106114.1 axin interactor, dorsalization-associated protein-like [Pomacea canaliculata]XP_025106115.1 axin interactor, dorsalization-associated protein-like [Pomacea canaliculata]XP_025106116.1 axin interactor, dorsalization-associated protein-like [Pomacea canaliculata]
MDENEMTAVVTCWKKTFKTATDFDVWGQRVEAVDMYKRLSKELHQHANSYSRFSDSQRKLLQKIAFCIDSRQRLLLSEKPSQVAGVSLNDLQRLESILSNILCHHTSEFPLDISMAHMQMKQHMGFRQKFESQSEDDKQEQYVNGSLLPRPLPVAGMTLLTVWVEKIGLKDVAQYIDPFLTVSVKDAEGKDMTTSQDTPVASDKDDTCIQFNMDVYIQKALESLPPGYAVFFELKHYKPKKRAVSTRCWSFLEKDEIKEGPVVLELYKKPTDFHRRNISLFTVKPLYLHLRLKLFR